MEVLDGTIHTVMELFQLKTGCNHMDEMSVCGWSSILPVQEENAKVFICFKVVDPFSGGSPKIAVRGQRGMFFLNISEDS